MSKEKVLTVGNIAFSRYKKPGAIYRNKITSCLVLWGGKPVAEYIDFGDGTPVHIHVLSGSLFAELQFSEVALGNIAQLENAIQNAITQAELERKLRERVKRDGHIAYRYQVDGEYRYNSQRIDEHSYYLLSKLRESHPSIQFYQRNFENGAWEWMK
jgi:hypothetical protein